jgi:multidrug efflux pump subunit AcrB
MQIGGEQAKQEAGFANLSKVLIISIIGIYAALLLQFGNAVKSCRVLAAAPYGGVGAFTCLAIMGSRFGFMAFLGVASLIEPSRPSSCCWSRCSTASRYWI